MSAIVKEWAKTGPQRLRRRRRAAGGAMTILADRRRIEPHA
ncbi:hypothetical protein BN2497_12949 [Janthinobacterium sp. CG23_2]|nr:hypothetical protein BN2497_12949 [Janthinobacterium sp. CG23_2]CUU32872.1 hypothetical protein BN3177_12949 [Janthinobacterium sp. CG23_2]